MDTRKVQPESPSASTDNCPVDTTPGQEPLNDYLRLPRVLIQNLHDDMVEFGRRHPEDPDVNGVDRTATIRLLAAILRRPPEIRLEQVMPAPVVPPATGDGKRLSDALKLLKECEKWLGTRARHVMSGTLEWRVGEFLAGTWPRKDEQ